MNAPLLPRLDPVRAARQSALLAALRGRSAGGEKLAVGLGDIAEASGWVVCAGGIAIAPLVGEGRRLPIRADGGEPDAVLAVAGVAALEPLLGIVEAALGTELLPGAIAAVAPDGVVVAVAGGGARLLLAVPDSAPVAPVAGPASIEGVQACWAIAVAAPPLGRRPARGDLLVGLGAAAVRLGDWRLPVAIAGAHAEAIGGWRTMMDDMTQDAATGASTLDPPIFDPAALELPVSVRIMGPPTSVADLARLGPGAVLPLPGAPGQVAVTVLAGGAPIGTGTLVALGDGHGVLFDRVFGSPAIGPD